MVSEPLLVGLDVGTTAVKAAAFDHGGRELAQGRAATPWREVPTGAEVDPGALLDAAVAAAREAVAAAGSGPVTGIGIASMAETGVLLDEHGEPVVPAIAWHDERGGDEAARLAADLPGFSARVGLPASALCTLAKYAWMREHLPGERARRPLAQRRRVGRSSASAASRPPSCRSPRGPASTTCTSNGRGTTPSPGPGAAAGLMPGTPCRPARRWAPPTRSRCAARC